MSVQNQELPPLPLTPLRTIAESNRMKYLTLLLLAILNPEFFVGNLFSQQNSTAEKTKLAADSTSSYQSKALQLMLREADAYALSLDLPEANPLTTNFLTEIYVSPPELANQHGGLGSLRTKSYSYAFGRGKRLAYITRLSSPENSKKSLYDANKHLAIAPALVNTNAAFLLATQWLEKAFVDVKKLTESNSVSIKPWIILDMVTSKYTVEWMREGEPVARVILIEPTKELLALRVEDPKYIMRPAIVVKP